MAIFNLFVEIIGFWQQPERSKKIGANGFGKTILHLLLNKAGKKQAAFMLYVRIKIAYRPKMGKPC